MDSATHRVVDGNNVMCARPDGWWRDRAGAKARLVARLQDHARHSGEHVTVFFDGRAVALPEAAGAVDVHFAPGGADAADDAIVQWLRGRSDHDRLCVVSSDAGLVARIRELGVATEGAGAFRRRLDSLGPTTTAG